MTFPRRESTQDADCQSCGDFLDSPLSVTGRVEDEAGARKRSRHGAADVESYSVGVRHQSDSLL